MKAQVLTGINAMEMVDVAMPRISAGDEVLLKLEVVGVCGSDVHYYETGRIGSQIVQYPYLVGHECSGRVVEVGADVENLNVGDLVAVEPAVACGDCDQCRMGRENTCRNLTFLGTPGQGQGCLCEYLVMPERNCFNVTGKLSAISAAICEPFTIGLYAANQGRISSNDKIAILGSGPIGLSCMVAARAGGTEKIYMTDLIDDRVAFAKNNGADFAFNAETENVAGAIGGGLDVVYECAGAQSAIDEGIELLRPGGKFVMVGIPRESRISFAIDQIRRKEITIVNIRRQNRTAEKAIEMMVSEKVNVDFMVTHKFPFSQSKDAFDLVAGYKDGVIKAMIEF